MTNQNDARVAEAVGYTIVRDANYQHKLRCFSPESKMLVHYAQRDIVLAKNIDSTDKFLIKNAPPPFDSGPTPDTDWIVLEWVQDSSIMNLFKMALVDLFPVDDDYIYMPDYQLNLFVQFYKPGMYAKALLATLEEKSDV